MQRAKLMQYIGSVAFAGMLAVSGAATFAGGDAPAPKDGGKVLEGPRADKEKGGLGRKGFSGEGRGQARPGGPGAPGRPGAEFVREVIEKLNLTDDQKSKVRTILEDTRKAHEEFRSKNEEALKQLREEAKAARESGDREKVRAVMEKLDKLMENAPKPADTINKIKAVLTAEQAKQLEEAVEAKKKELREQMEKRRAEMEKNGEKPGGHAKELRERRQGEKSDQMMDDKKPAPPASDKAGGDKLNL